MTTPEFDAEYKRLNPEQRKAVDAIEGPVMVIAGPGTGKTQTLTLRIANILKETDTAPENILALTFTESGAHSMRKRLVDIIGSRAYKIPITTFHGFCNEIIGRYPDQFPRIIGGTVAAETDQIHSIEEILESGGYKTLRPFGDPSYYVRAILTAVHHLKREGISPETFKKLVAAEEAQFAAIDDLYYTTGAHKGKMKGKYKDIEKYIEKNKELAAAYSEYQTKLEEAHLYDYEDMIMEVVRAMENDGEFLLMLQEEYQYILADEHQDTNNAQNRVLELLASFYERPNLFIVGDEKQAIFRFQGASLANFLYFKEKYPSVLLITLEKNYRSTQSILDSAHSVIDKNQIVDPSLRARLQAQAQGKGDRIHVYPFARSGDEEQFLVHNIEKKIQEGVPAHEIAVLYRDNKDAFPIARAFEKAGVPFVIESDTDLISDEDIARLLLLLRAVNELGNEALLAEVLYIEFLNIEPLDIYKVVAHAHKEHTELFDVIRSREALGRAGVSNADTLYEFYKKLSSWATVAKNKSLLDLLDVVIRESGFLEFIMAASGSVGRMAKLESFIDYAKRVAEGRTDYKLSDLIDHLNILAQYNVRVKNSDVPQQEGVRLMTAHRSKGLEFDYVYITRTQDKKWGGRRKRSNFKFTLTDIALSFEGDDEDERRLFYVAITRARKGIAITYAEEGIDGKHQLPSQFIEEIDPPLVEITDTKDFETQTSAEILSSPEKRITAPNITDKEYLRERFIEQGLSVTALNNYLTCPWQFFYNNLIRVPSVPGKFQLFGIAVHRVLKEFFDDLKKGKDRGKPFLTKRITELLKKQPLTSVDLEELIQKGVRALSGYYDTYRGTWNSNVLTELHVDGVTISVEDADGSAIELPLKGQLDKIEITEAGPVAVVDYKTGKPKTRNQVEGKTKTSDGGYKRQLVFYKLLLDTYEDGKYDMQLGAIDFVEPDEKGRYHKEQFDVTPDEVAELRELVAQTAHEILTLSFWDKTCGKTDCPYCALRLIGAHR